MPAGKVIFTFVTEAEHCLSEDMTVVTVVSDMCDVENSRSGVHRRKTSDVLTGTCKNYVTCFSVVKML